MSNVDLDKGGRIPQNVKTYLGPTIGWRMTDSPVDLEYTFEGGGGIPLLGTRPPIIVPDWLVVYEWVILSGISGSCVIDVWKKPYVDWIGPSGTPPTVADSIAGSDKPTLTNAYGSNSIALTGWTTQINQNDALVFNLESISLLTSPTLILRCVRILGNP